jgi:hypothetical protein
VPELRSLRVIHARGTDVGREPEDTSNSANVFSLFRNPVPGTPPVAITAPASFRSQRAQAKRLHEGFVLGHGVPPPKRLSQYIPEILRGFGDGGPLQVRSPARDKPSTLRTQQELGSSLLTPISFRRSLAQIGSGTSSLGSVLLKITERSLQMNCHSMNERTGSKSDRSVERVARRVD